uniref:Immunoglobulin V-set domain-containing protein n=1 Tax=Amphiprion percula TaxID=161767 RepID=A0A3P8TTY4_AMPPE
MMETRKQKHLFVAGDDVLLDCRSLHNDVTLLEWIRPDLKADGYVFFYRERRLYENYQHPYFHGRVKLGDLRMENGNMSRMLGDLLSGVQLLVGFLLADWSRNIKSSQHLHHLDLSCGLLLLLLLLVFINFSTLLVCL